MNRILVIDDDKELCALIKRSVQTENIEADCCNSGKEGLINLKEKEYQLVVLDVMMPGMDGFETLEQIRKESSLPILMFTSKNCSLSKKARKITAAQYNRQTNTYRLYRAEQRVRQDSFSHRESRARNTALQNRFSSLWATTYRRDETPL